MPSGFWGFALTFIPGVLAIIAGNVLLLLLRGSTDPLGRAPVLGNPRELTRADPVVHQADSAPRDGRSAYPAPMAVKTFCRGH